MYFVKLSKRNFCLERKWASVSAGYQAQQMWQQCSSHSGIIPFWCQSFVELDGIAKWVESPWNYLIAGWKRECRDYPHTFQEYFGLIPWNEPRSLPSISIQLHSALEPRKNNSVSNGLKCRRTYELW